MTDGAVTKDVWRELRAQTRVGQHIRLFTIHGTLEGYRGYLHNTGGRYVELMTEPPPPGRDAIIDMKAVPIRAIEGFELL